MIQKSPSLDPVETDSNETIKLWQLVLWLTAMLLLEAIRREIGSRTAYDEV
jgi:hypothetical protein